MEKSVTLPSVEFQNPSQAGQKKNRRNQMKWIETSQRMPRHQKTVLFLYRDTEGTEFLTGWFDEDNNEWVSAMITFFRYTDGNAFEDSHFATSQVKYWMQIPRTPEKIE